MNWSFFYVFYASHPTLACLPSQHAPLLFESLHTILIEFRREATRKANYKILPERWRHMRLRDRALPVQSERAMESCKQPVMGIFRENSEKSECQAKYAWGLEEIAKLLFLTQNSKGVQSQQQLSAEKLYLTFFIMHYIFKFVQVILSY